MKGLRLWYFLTGDLPCSPKPVCPIQPVIPENASEDDKAQLLASYDDNLLAYDTDFVAYRTWLDEDARAASILVASMEECLAADIVYFDFSHQMWTSLHDLYEPSGQSLYIDALRQEQLLQQGDATVEEFYAHMSAVWRQLDSLSPQLSVATCESCRGQKNALFVRHTYDFLTRLRAEFELLHAQLLARQPCVSLMDALAAIHNEETCLRTAGLLQSPSALAVRSPPPPPAAPSSMVPSSRVGGSGSLHCKYCDKDGHVEDYCYMKKKAQGRRGGRTSQGGSSASSPGTGGSQRGSAGSETQEILMLLRRLAASTPPGVVGSITPASAPSNLAAAASQSSTEGPLSTSALGTFPWILDSGASFHMTHDRTNLSSISTPSIPITVHTADGSPLSVAGRGTLLSDSFHVPAVSYVPKLTMQLISAGQLTDHGCRVILDSDSCCVQDHSTGLLVGTSPRRRDSQRL
ncbi:uncharacterized protein LOC133895084 [Phragmites australis]|uniref:uncharacterized protein LOC133895084 n=1 Tax=Phragmites australis TaxID=29695 RepID=UPI002D76D26E|nr:uncharacterized protein LOC133895084 [Phragmites australis]